MTDGMIEHLKMLIRSALFNPVWLGFLVACYIGGRILGSFMPMSVVKPMVVIFLIVLVGKLFFFQTGYDLYFLMGFPFMGGLWQGSRKWSF